MKRTLSRSKSELSILNTVKMSIDISSFLFLNEAAVDYHSKEKAFVIS